MSELLIGVWSIAAIVALTSGGYAWWRAIQMFKLSRACDKSAQEARQRTEDFIKRFPLLLKMDKLARARGQVDNILELIEDTPDDIMQAMAFGAADLVASQSGIPELEDLVARKAEFLAGKVPLSDYEIKFADAIERLSFPTPDYSDRRELDWRHRVVIAGCATDGHAGFVSVLKHYAEGHPNEGSAEQEKAG